MNKLSLTSPIRQSTVEPIVIPNILGWLDDSNSDDFTRTICRGAILDIGIAEDPEASNRGPRIDRYVLKHGGQLGDYYCAAFMSEWFVRGGAKLPPKGLRLSCAEWHKWALNNSTLVPTPRAGYGVLYAEKGGVAHHCGLVLRVFNRSHALIRTIEANTTVAGYSRNGEGVEYKMADLGRVLGYIRPVHA